MIGSWTIQVSAVKPFSIHGDLYYEIQGARVNDSSREVFSLKLPQHAARGVPQPGQTLLVKFLMGQVTEARLVASSDAGAAQPQ